MSLREQTPPLSWSERDIEQRLGFRGGKYTQVNYLLTCILSIALTIAFYASLLLISETAFADMFTDRGPTPYFIVWLSCWALVILIFKSRKLALQRQSLKFVVVPTTHDFVLSATTVNEVIQQIHATVDDPRNFMLFNRIIVALSNLKNLGRVADVDDILRAQADQEESSLETSYSVLQGFIWAIPVLGFIGTVLGLSEAIGAFGSVLGAASDVSQITDALRGVTAGLKTAFETTLEALVAALVIQLWMTFLKKSEEEFHDACAEYCIRNVVGHLRVMPFENVAE